MKKLSDMTLLYIEDNFDAQKTLKLLLEDEVKELYQAYNGKEALAIYEKKQPDIIITDINMPYMDGLSFAKKIKKHNRDQLIVIISGYDNKENLLEAIDIGIDQFLSKPIDIESLFEKLDKLIERSNKRRKKMKLAYYDNLTNIYNRHYFDLKLEKSIQRTQNEPYSLTLFFIDLNDFKIINDNYGHITGDKVLKKVAQNLSTVLNEEDLLARIGGDEFAILIETDNKKEINKIRKKITQATNFTLKINNDLSNCYNAAVKEQTISVSCSIGSCSLCDLCNSKESFLHCADVNMYKEKNSTKQKNRPENNR